MDPALLVVAAALLAAYIIAFFALHEPRTSRAVRSALRQGAVVLDVRTPDEYVGDHYPGAVNIPLEHLAKRVDELDRDRPIVVYCTSGMRSSRAVKVLKRAGFRRVADAGTLHGLPASRTTAGGTPA